jgi:Carboxypeptidase regulatory-like domain
MERFPTALAASVPLAALLVAACGSSPTAPTVPPASPSVNPAGPPPPSFVTRRLSGIVRDGSNRAVASAIVTVHNSNGSKRSVSTDANGFYDTSADLNQNYAVPWLSMEVSKPGYEDTRNGALARNQDTNRDLCLFELARLTAGSEAQLSATFEGPLCGFELEYACRRLQVVSPASGTLTIELVAEDPSSAFAFGPVTYPMPNPSPRMSRAVSRGQTLDVEILLVSANPWSGWRAVTVKTSLVP